MTDTGHIFLSYRSIEADFALKLAADLKNAGVRLWMDRLDGIQVGMDWRDAIQGAINTCTAMIAVMSPDYVESEYCKKELARANTLQRPILPVLLRRVKDENWPFVIQGVQYEDFTDWLDPKKYAVHLDRLLARLKKDATAQVGTIPDSETRYLTTLIAELEAARGVLQYIPLSGQMDQPQDVRPQPLPIDEWGYSELVRSTHTSGPNKPDPYEGHEERIPLANIAEAVQKHPRFVLIGEPGAGKTTTIRRLALDAAHARMDNRRTAPIPLLLYLPQWDTEATPAEFVQSHWQLDGEPMGMLKRGDILLYLDGLNEMGARGLERAKQLTKWLESPDAPARVIVTCRSGDYVGGLWLGETPTVLVQELNDAQVRQFVTNYLQNRAAAFLTHVLSENEETRESAHSLARLAHNPYMLSALIVVYEHGGNLPRNTGTLFRRLARALWARETARGTTSDISFEQADSAFARLAFAMIDEDKPFDVSVAYMVQKLGDDGLLQVGLSANYLKLDGDLVRFHHQLFQEYFAAMTLERMGLPLRTDIVRERWTPSFQVEGKWDEVVITLCGISSDVGEVINEVAAANPLLAAKCISSGIEVHRSLSEKIINSQLATLCTEAGHSTLGDKRARHAANILEEMDEHAIPGLLELLKKREPLTQERDEASVIIVETLANIGTPAIVPGMLQALNFRSDDNLPIRRMAIRALGKFRYPVAIPELLELLRREEWQDAIDDIEEAFKRIGEPAIPALLSAFSWRPTNRAEWVGFLPRIGCAANALVHIGQPAVFGLAELLQTQNVKNSNRMKAKLLKLRILGPSGDLTQFYFDVEIKERLCDFLSSSLVKIGTPEALTAVEAWRKEQKKE